MSAAAAKTRPDGSMLAEVDDLYARYAGVLGSGDMSGWPDLFTQECSYFVYPAMDFERGLPLAYMYDDNRSRVQDRVKFVKQVWAGTVEPYRMRHVYQRTATTLDAALPELVNANCNFMIAYTQTDGTSALLCSGYAHDIIDLSGPAALFRSRRLLLDGVPARYLIYPL